jgi:hypothetical protein|tara:strand:- start:129 stop:320 length:192 start_codon:yes stop_codon:yes gene_type:complete
MSTIDATDARLSTHEEVCAVRYEAIHARLKRMENLLVKVGGSIILILLTAFGTVTLMFLETVK